MCGAFSVILTPRGWQEVFRVPTPAGWRPVYNARPGEVLPIITAAQPQQATEAIWNFQPHWMTGAGGQGVINARAESIDKKLFFRTAFKTKRCLIPADGFYEWERRGQIKAPYRFTRKDERPFALAGLYDELPDHSGNIGFAIITTHSNDLVGKIHDRMPVILDQDEEDKWLSLNTTPWAAQELLGPFPADLMKMFPVSRLVSYAKEKGPEVIKPLKKLL